MQQQDPVTVTAGSPRTVAAPEGSPRASDPRAQSALPAMVHDRPAATLLVDLDQGTVVFANLLAVELAPDLRLPVSLDEWSRQASLQTPDGTPLEDGPHTLAQIAHGEPARGMQVDAERASDESAAREALWIMGIPLSEAPAPLSHQALVILLPLRQEDAVRALQDSAGDLHARAATAGSCRGRTPTAPSSPTCAPPCARAARSRTPCSTTARTAPRSGTRWSSARWSTTRATSPTTSGSRRTSPSASSCRCRGTRRWPRPARSPTGCSCWHG